MSSVDERRGGRELIADGASERMQLPNLLIVGVKKAGTSSLFDYLAQLPDVCPSTVKETAYFSPLLRDDGSLRPLRYYAGFFTACGAQKYRMEATPDYFYGGPRVIRSIARTLPHPRVIVTLRDPVTRLWSHYRMKKRLGSAAVAGATFDEFVHRCEAVGVDWIHGSPESWGYAALAQGRYVDYLGEWFDAFGEDVKVVFMESWSDRPQDAIREISRWLGLDENVAMALDYAVANKGIDYRSRGIAKAARAMYDPAVRMFLRRPRLRRLLPAMTYLRRVHTVLNAHHQPRHPEEVVAADTRRHLDDLYRESNRQLAEVLVRRGYRDLPPWLSSALPEG